MLNSLSDKLEIYMQDTIFKFFLFYFEFVELLVSLCFELKNSRKGHSMVK